MGIKLESRDRSEKTTSMEERQAANLLNQLFSHSESSGAVSSISFGLPGSCKTAISLVFCAYAQNHYPEDKIFWRSALNAPLQFMKLPDSNYKIYVEKDSGTRFFDRRTSLDVTSELKVSYFSNFEQLYSMCEGGVCSAIFFKDKHIRGIGNDYGTVGWLNYLNFLLGKYAWCHVFFDEYFEVAGSGSNGALWHQLNLHARDVSNCRKSNISLHSNAHAPSDIDFRVLSKYMTTIMTWGSRPTARSPLNKAALGGLRKPDEKTGASAWASAGGAYGKFSISEVMSCDKSYMARILPELEDTLVCPTCDRVFLREDVVDSQYCSHACIYSRRNRKKEDSSPPSPHAH